MNEQARVKPVFSQAKRQHVLGVLRFFTRNVWTLARSFWPVLAGLAISDSIRMYAGLIGAVGVLFLSVVAFLEHWRFTFKIEASALVIERGIIERERMVIPFDRIQTVHTEELFWHRMFGLVGLRIDTAGSSGAEVEISALKKSEAQQLNAILSRGATSHIEAVQPLVQLDWQKLLRIGLTQNHLRNAIISFGAVVAVIEPLMQWLEQGMDALPWAWVWALKLIWVLAIPLFFLFFLLVGLLVSLVGAILRYHKLTVRLADNQLEMSGGFLKKFEFKLPLHKIQMLESKSGILQRIAGFETVRIHQARSQVTSDGGAVNVLIPGLNDQETAVLASRLFLEDFTRDAKVLRPHRLFWIRRSIWRSVFGLIPFLLFPHPLVLLLFIAWMLWSILASLRKYQGTSFVVKPTELLFRTGWRVQVKRRVEWRKLQRVSIRSNWFMQRKGLADVVLSTAAGPITLPYVRVESAKQLRDWGLFQIESSSAPWM